MFNPVFNGNFYLHQRPKTTSDTIVWIMGFVALLEKHGLRISTEVFPSTQRWEYTGQPLSNEMLHYFTRTYDQDGAINISIGSTPYPISFVFVNDTDPIARAIFLQQSRQAFTTDESGDTSAAPAEPQHYHQLLDVITLVCEYTSPLFGYGHIGYLEEVDDYTIETSHKKSLAQGLLPDLSIIADVHTFYYYSRTLLPPETTAIIQNSGLARLDTLSNGGSLYLLPTEFTSFTSAKS